MDLMPTGLMRRPFAHLAAAWRGLWIGPVSTGSPDFERLFSAPISRSGIQVSEHTALTYSAFWACVNAISTDVASLPLIHYKRASGGGKERYTDSKLYRLLHDEPNPEMTSITMRQTLTAHALTWGNGYAEIERDGQLRPLYLWPLTPGRVAPYRDEAGKIAYLVRRADGGDDTVPAADMLHIPGLGFDGMTGYSVVEKARESVGLGLATERFGSTFFGNGATFGGVISYPGPRPTELSEKNYRESLELKHQGVERAHKLLALYNGAKYERSGIPPNDAQFLETRLHQIEEMCRWFRMPPHKIQHLLRATNNNIEHQGIEYYTDTMRPWTVRWEQEINRKLISPMERRIQFVEHMIDGVLRGDLQSRYAAYAIGRQWGWLCADDICDRENMNPLPNGQGKIYLVPTNMAPADRIGELIDAQIKSKTTPPATPTPPDAAAAANARAEAAEHAATEAREMAQREHDERIAAEASGTATAAELEQRRISEAGAQALAAQLTQLAAEVRAQAETLQAALLEAQQRAAQEQRAREAAEADATRAHAKHAKATAHITTAQAALAEAEGKRQASEGNLDQALAQAAQAEARAATLADELSNTGVRAGTYAGERDAALAVVATLESALAEARAALTATDTERARLDAELAAREVCVPEDEQRLVALADLTDQLATAHRVVEAGEAALRTAREQLATTEVRLVSETEARAAAETLATTQRETERQRMTAVIGAHRGLIADAMGRMIRRETEKARRAQATPEKLRHWIANFYDMHRDVCVDALLPAMRAHLAWTQSTNDPAATTEQIVRVHIEESIRQLRAAADADPVEDFPSALERLLTRWELHRADECADRVLKEALEHVTRDH